MRWRQADWTDDRGRQHGGRPTHVLGKGEGFSLVTGGAGFIGAHVATALLERGHKVVVLDDLSGGFEDNVPQEQRSGRDLSPTSELVEQLFEEHRPDYVFHLAAYAAEGLSHFIRRFNYTNNVSGASTSSTRPIDTRSSASCSPPPSPYTARSKSQ